MNPSNGIQPMIPAAILQLQTTTQQQMTTTDTQTPASLSLIHQPSTQLHSPVTNQPSLWNGQPLGTAATSLLSTHAPLQPDASTSTTASYHPHDPRLTSLADTHRSLAESTKPNNPSPTNGYKRQRSKSTFIGSTPPISISTLHVPRETALQILIENSTTAAPTIIHSHSNSLGSILEPLSAPSHHRGKSHSSTSSNYTAALAARHGRRPSTSKRPESSVIYHEDLSTRGLNSILESVASIRDTTELGPPPESGEEFMQPEPDLSAAAPPTTKRRVPSILCSSTSSPEPMDPSEKEKALRRSSIVQGVGLTLLSSSIPPPAAASSVATVSSSTLSSSTSHSLLPSTNSSSSTNTPLLASTKPPGSKLLQNLVDAKLKLGGEQTVRALQAQHETERDATATLKKECLGILQLPPETRSEQQQTHLLRWMQSQNSFLLKELSSSVLRELCLKVTLATFKSGQIVFRQGAPSDAFYIIVTGSVSIWIAAAPKKKDSVSGAASVDDEAEVFNQVTDVAIDPNTTDNTSTTDVTSDVNDGGDKTPSTTNDPTDNEPDSANLRKRANSDPSKCRRPVGPGLAPNSICVGVMAASEEKSAFGELGLVSGEARSATIKCEEYTELLRVSKTDFLTTLKTYSDSLQRKVRLLSIFPGFKDSSNDQPIVQPVKPEKPTKDKSKPPSAHRKTKSIVGATASILTSSSNKISTRFLSRLAIFFRERTISSRTCVFSQGDRCEYVYFLVNGEVELLQKVDHEISPGLIKRIEVVVAKIVAQIPDYLNEVTPDDKPAAPVAETDNAEAALEASKHVPLPLIHRKSSSPTTSAAHPSSSHSHITCGQILGESPLFLKSLRQCYDYTLRTVGSCTFFVMKSSDFLRRMNYVILSRFQSRLKEKLKWREQRLREIRLPNESVQMATVVKASSKDDSDLKKHDRKKSGTLPNSARGIGFSHATQSTNSSSWSTRKKQLQLASNKNLRLLPTLTQASSLDTLMTTRHTGDKVLTDLSAFEEAALPKSARTIQKAVAAAAHQRAEEVKERDRDRGLTMKPPHHIDSAFSSAPLSPVTSASSGLILDVNPTMALTRRGSFGLAPDLRPMIQINALQRMDGSNENPQQQVLMPHSLPMSMPTLNLDSSSLDHPRPLMTAASRSRDVSPDGLTRKPSSGTLVVPPSTRRAISSVTGRVALTPEQHLVLSTQLRSTDAATRAKKIVKVMQEMKERNEDWTVYQQKNEQPMSPSGTQSFVPLPIDNAREMWQMREMKRERKKAANMNRNLNDPAVSTTSTNDAPTLHESSSLNILTGWQTLNPKSKSVRTETVQHSTSGKLLDPAAELHALLTESSSHLRSQRMKELNVLGRLNHRVHITPTLLQDLSVIAPKSSILQEALAGGKSRDTQTHRTSGSVAHTNVKLLNKIDWPSVLSAAQGAPNQLIQNIIEPTSLGVVSHPGANQHNTNGTFQPQTQKELMEYKEITTESLLAHAHALNQVAKVVVATAASTPPTDKPHRPSVHFSSHTSPRLKLRSITHMDDALLPHLPTDTNPSSQCESSNGASPKSNRSFKLIHGSSNTAPLNRMAMVDQEMGISVIPIETTTNEPINSTITTDSPKRPRTIRPSRRSVESKSITSSSTTVPILYQSTSNESDSISFTQSIQRHDRSSKCGYQAQVRYG